MDCDNIDLVQLLDRERLYIQHKQNLYLSNSKLSAIAISRRLGSHCVARVSLVIASDVGGFA
ncbi:MAG: hypothetical protein HC903_18555 [Methylacidiphilales bacterium]|nr:hypothetical protein [Candidatus Methylacidiphilales bacterium]